MNLALYGSGEFTPAVNEIDDYLISKYKLKSIAIIPTAAGKEKSVNKWFNMAHDHFSQFNIKVIDIPIFKHYQADEANLVQKLAVVDWIFFSGGQPDYLLKTIQNSLLLKTVKNSINNNLLVSGSSAGAMIMGNYILVHPFKMIFSNAATNWTEAFRIVDYTILPHFNKISSNKKFIKNMTTKSPPSIKESWLGIDENTALLINNQGMKVLGKGRVEIHKLGQTTIIHQ